MTDIIKKLSKKEQFKEDIMRCRGVDFIELNMVVEVDGKRGIIKGMNRSANLDVAFDDHPKHKSNCHPFWRTKFFNKDGNLIKEYKD